ncbi:hypothetical protein JCM6882_001512 [Rhodosporidiobolus microsporus]
MSSQDPASAQGASTEPQLPWRTINDLPTELKERIVELCAEQDRLFRERLDEMKKDDMARAVVSGSAVSLQGRSVKALFRVNKEFSRLAAPCLFRVLKASKADIHFKCAIAPYRLAHFRELHLDTQEGAKLQDVLGALPRLVHLRVLVVSTRNLEALWDYGRISFDTASLNGTLPQYAASTFRHLDNKLEEIRTQDVKMTALRPFTTHFASCLRTLNLQFAVHTSARFEGLAGVVSSCTQLQTLRLDYLSQRHSSYVFDLSNATSACTFAPPLRRLEIVAGQLHTSMIPFAALFSATLESLSLAATTKTYPTSISPPPHLTSETFPRVEQFSLSGLDTVVRATWRSIEPRHFPSLATLELDLTNCPWLSPTNAPLSTFSSFTSLRTLRIPNLSLLPMAASQEIGRFADANGLALSSWTTTSASRPPTSLQVPRTPPALQLGSEVRTTLAFLAERVQQAEQCGSQAALLRYKDTLKSIEVERVVEELWRGA